MPSEAFRDSVDLIIPWAKVQPGDLVLIGDKLVLVVHAEHGEDTGPLGTPVKIVILTYDPRNGSGKWTAVHAAAGLTAVRRLVTCALCGTVLARDGNGTWGRRDEPVRGLAVCFIEVDEEPPAHEPAVLDVADYARLRLALAELEEANARRCWH